MTAEDGEYLEDQHVGGSHDLLAAQQGCDRVCRLLTNEEVDHG